MSTAEKLARDDAAARHWLAEVSRSATTFERRWTWRALERVNPDIARKLREQRDLFDEALITGTADEIETHGGAMCRGYGVAVRVLEGAAEPDDAYVLGLDSRTGFRVAIGNARPAAQRVAEVHGEAVVWITPDEVAAVLAGLEQFKSVALIKRLFPGAEMIDIRPGEPAKRDSGVEA